MSQRWWRERQWLEEASKSKVGEAGTKGHARYLGLCGRCVRSVVCFGQRHLCGCQPGKSRLGKREVGVSCREVR